ncbi:interleukin-6 receptor subunit beta isoform X2 [Hyla sarda]|uniref:interleukin-6 receptor subunit beta isoform X2 n=1 Tax=Hyla sarda TaxID=327740 RepID=UPI0024C3058B|nr:interleukin-6 receptor subunit beta isoform X2 [Hyla sarda]
MRQLSLLCALCAILVAADGRTLHSCAYITPQDPFVVVDTNLTAFCHLNETCIRELGHPITSRDLFWKVGDTVIPESHYTVVNNSVSSVTFQPTLAMHNSVTCSFKAYGQTEATLHGIYFSLGYPPEKPENLTCVCYNAETLTCTWEPGRDPIIATTYTLKQSWINEQRKDCIAEAGKNSCTLNYPDFILHINTVFSVEAANELGRAESDRLEFDINDIVKPNPPHIVRVFDILQKVLKIEWENPFESTQYFQYNIRYRPLGSSQWSEVPSEDLEKTRKSFILQELQPYTTYNIIMRCKLIDKGFWSKWSKEYTATTSESTPSKGPEFWRKIIRTDSEKRVVQLMWKDLKSHANGRILGYNVTVKKGAEVETFRVVDTTCNITVPEGSYDVLLTAYNSQGSSPPSRLKIPSDTDQKVVKPEEMNFKAFPKDGELWVEWAPLKGVFGYVIEWCSNHETMDCNAEWQREPSNVTKTFLRGDIKPFVYYLIRLIPLYTDGKVRSSIFGTYLQQGAPDVGPAVKTKATGKTWVTLVWIPIPLPQRNGFITNYTIKYGGHDGPAEAITVNASVTEYTLKSLAAKTTYSVSVTANTEQGRKAGLPFSLTTLPFGNGEVEAIVVASCIGFMVLILILCVLFCNKREQIKQHIWPNVPDPSKSNIAQWSPQTPSRHEPKRHPFQDGPFTDVSVVQITRDDKPDDQDTKSLDQIKKNTSEGLSSGIGGSSCLSSPHLSASDSDGISCAQNTSSTVQYSTVIMGGYQGQTPMFSRSESTQPLLISEERPDEQSTPPPASQEDDTQTPSQYFKQNFTVEESGRNQEPPPVLHLAGFSQGLNNPDFTAGCNVNPDGQSQEDEPKTYLPQTMRQGGYLPQLG